MQPETTTGESPKRARRPAEAGEEARTLVSDGLKRTNEYEGGGSSSGEGRWSFKCQVITIFLFTATFMFFVGFVVGRDSLMAAINLARGNTDPSGVKTGGGAGGAKETTSAPTLPPTEAAETLKFNVNNLLAAKTEAQAGLKALEDYWGEWAEKVLLGDVGFTFGFKGPNKEPSNAASFKRTKDIIARVLVHGEALKLGFIGSSVMCGHDNCYYDSFPEQLRRFVGSAFKKATGKDMDIRNACQGGTCGDGYQNQIFCFRHMVGDDIDMLFYEWTYFENDQAVIHHEAITRWATLLPKVPATIVINCDRNAWGNADLPRRYAAFGANGINLEAGLKEGPYKGKVWGEVGDGVHSTTRYGDSAGVSEARKKSLGVVFRNWHPGPLGLQYVSDLTSYLLLRALIAAVDEITANPSKAPKTWPVEPILYPPLPEIGFSKSKDPYWYELASISEEAPGCYTIQRSTFGKPQPVIADRNEDALNPYKDLVTKVNNPNDPKSWTVWNAEVNWAMVPREERSMGDMCKPPDNCAYFVEPHAGPDKTPFVWRLPKMTVGMVVLCGFGGEAGKEMLKQKDKFKVEFDGKLLDSSKFEVFPLGKCLAVQKRFSGPVENKHGHLYLSIVTTIPLRISQILTA